MPQLEVRVAVAKTGKYATRESGDTVEMVERPHGGLSIVLADGQRSGKAAKAISNIVVRKALSLLAEGVRDGAVARAAHDYLRTMRGGKVSATLNIVSVDLETETLVLSRNSHCPTVLIRAGEAVLLDEPSEPVGIRSWTRPVVTEMPIDPDTYVIAFSDGLLYAGRRRGHQMDVLQTIQELVDRKVSVRKLADAVLARAIELDQGRPGDDISVVALSVVVAPFEADDVRRMSVCLPIWIKREFPDGGCG
jgi:serine phosphatase RsbU (regulator of sigma subunit)